MSNKKVLFITVVDIYDNHGNGGVKCSQRNLTLLKKIFGDENVIVASFPRNEYTIPPKGAITFPRTQNNFQHLVAALLGCKVYFPWKEREIIQFIEQQNADLLFIDSSILGRLARIRGNFKKLVFFHNVEADYAFNKVRNEGIRFWPSYYASKKNEIYAMKYADLVVCLNQRDADNLKDLYGRGADYNLPITLPDQFDERQAGSAECLNNRILFVGSLMPQNQISVEWFIDNVMAKLPDVTLDIVGKGFEKKKEDYERNLNVKVIGAADNLGEYYYSHAIVVLPILYGSGMKVKTAEAMMYGKIIIGSDEALEGYDVNGVEGIYRCNTEEDYIQAIRSNINKDNGLLRENIRNLFLSKYESGSIVNEFKNFIDLNM